MLSKYKFLKYAAFVLCGLSLSAQAEQITVDVSATVSYIDDPYGVIGDISIGNVISGVYVYDTITPDGDLDPATGLYFHTPGSGYMDLSLGAYNLKTDLMAPEGIHVHTANNPSWDPTFEGYHAVSFVNLPTNGATIHLVNIDMWGNGGDALTSDALLPTPPYYLAFNAQRSVNISGSKNGNWFSITADLTAFGGGSGGGGGGSGSGSGSGAAEACTDRGKYSYKVTATVDYLYDPMGKVAGSLDIGNTVTAEYIIDPTTPVSTEMPGIYIHAPGTGSIKMEFAGITVTSNDFATAVDAYVNDGKRAPPYYDPVNDSFGVVGYSLTSSDTLISPQIIHLDFFGSEYTFSGDAMLDDVRQYPWEFKNLHFSATDLSIGANITEIQPLCDMAEVVPSDSRIHPIQRFDAVFFIDSIAPIIDVTGTLNGMDIKPYLDAECMPDGLIPGLQSFVCRDIHNLLMPGNNELNVSFTLDDGKYKDAKAIWNVLQP